MAGRINLSARATLSVLADYATLSFRNMLPADGLSLTEPILQDIVTLGLIAGTASASCPA